MFDFGPIAQEIARLLYAITDDQLSAPTPCPDYRLGDIVEHVGGLTLAFTAAAEKDLDGVTSQAPAGDARRLEPDWRDRIAAQLDKLVAAWRNPEAWQGMTRAGGVDLPGEVAGLVAADELVIHGWDISRASGLPYHQDAAALEASAQFLSMSAKDREPGKPVDEGSPFGAVVPVAEDASLLDRVVGLSGRDPSWRPVNI